MVIEIEHLAKRWEIIKYFWKIVFKMKHDPSIKAWYIVFQLI